MVCSKSEVLYGILVALQWWREQGVKGATTPGVTVQGVAFAGVKIWKSEILHPELSILLTVHTNAVVVTIRISIGNLIAGVGQQQRRLAWAVNTLAPPLLHCHGVY